MNERSALFANVLENPSDDTARLVLADWLDEHDEDVFGRFLRAGVTASRFRDEALIDDPDYYSALGDLAAVTTSGWPAYWLSELGVGPRPLNFGDWVWDNTADRVTVRIGSVSGVFARGLLSELIAPLADWYELVPRVLAAWPLERAEVTNAEGLSFSIEAPAIDRPSWRLMAAFTVSPRRHRLRRRGALQPNSEEPLRRPIAPMRWDCHHTFPNRTDLVQHVAPASMELMGQLRDAVGPEWPL
ncbi:hypothetical protein VT84_15410 [Gemmata sp. SH-PL17]|uniref:TIGR02996 domain-containing protein n=1 Tax=Gemmata sp. SH-PL17 TaxID=1630693 RepID=UPI00078BF409|nr:TIGR02996 domain-containing protein [Gemmata sp. SH-PL17]AMV25784.1 hypothetical protein VT84_15410 [Gemmata sp. SH-PL17]